MKPRTRGAAARSPLPLAVVLVLLALVVVPSWFNPYSTHSFEPDKMHWLRAAGIGAALALWRPRAWPRAAWPFMLWGAAQVLTTFTSVDIGISLVGSDARLAGLWTALALLAVAAVTWRYVTGPDVRRLLWQAATLGSVAVVSLALAQAMGWHPLRVIGATEAAGRVVATLGNPVFLGGYLTLVMPPTVWLAWQARAEARWAYGLLALGQVAALVLTQARGAWLGLLAGLWVALLLVAAAERNRRLATAVVALSIGALASLVALNLPSAEPLRSVPYVGRLVGLGAAGSTGGQRFLIWQGTVEALQGDPARALLGWGPETMPLAYYPHYPPTLAEYEPDAVVRLPDRAHNLWWDAAMSGGAILVVATAALWAAALAGGLRRLGLVVTRRATATLAGVGVGGAALAVLLNPSVGVALLPLGMSVGLLAGLGGWLCWQAWQPPMAPGERQTLDGEAVALLAALAAHFVELQFGFQVAATALLFWLYVPLLVRPPTTGATTAPTDSRVALGLVAAALLAVSYGLVAGGAPLALMLSALIGAVVIAFARAIWPAVPLAMWSAAALAAVAGALALALVAGRLAAGSLWSWLGVCGALGTLLWWLASPLSRRGSRPAWIFGVVAVTLWGVIVARPVLADLAHKHGLLLAGQGRVAEGYAWVARSTAWQPLSDTYRHSWAALHLPLADMTGDVASAGALCGRAVAVLDEGWQRRPRAVVYAEWLADVAQRSGDVAAAADWYEAGLHRFPNNVQWMAALARLYVQAGDGAAAEALLLRLESATPRYYPAYIVWAEWLERRGEAGAALAAFRQATEVAWWSGEARLALAQALRRAGEMEQALAELRAAVPLLSDDRKSEAERLLAAWQEAP